MRDRNRNLPGIGLDECRQCKDGGKAKTAQNSYDDEKPE
jgi:hypothetical protein